MQALATSVREVLRLQSGHDLKQGLLKVTLTDVTAIDFGFCIGLIQNRMCDCSLRYSLGSTRMVTESSTGVSFGGT